MNFSKIIGNIDPKLVAKAEEKLTQIFLELGTSYNNDHVGSQLGGDSIVFSLMYPIEHICTNNIPTAATDGRRFYWNAGFILKQSRVGLRLICGHEAWHAIYLHPQRRGSRIPKLWNIAVDYIVNGNVMEDLKVRKHNPGELFNKHMGKYMTLKQYAELLKNPFKKVDGFDELDATAPQAPEVQLPGPMEDRELTPAEIKELERREKMTKFYFADPDLEEDMKRPERIYDFLYQLLPKCPDCGRVGVYQLPKKNKKQDQQGQDKDDQNKDKKDKSKGKGKKDKQQTKGQDQQGDSQDNQSHDHGDGQPCNCPNHDDQGDGQGDGQGQGDQQGSGQGQGCEHGCPSCGGGFDIFGFGSTMDDHMDTEESEEKLARRVSDAIESARKMAGHIPAGLEDELGKLTAPKITWQDVIRSRLLKARAGNGRNDWTRFKSRPMFSGLLVPKRRSYYTNFGCLLDTSGSMSKDDMAFGVSQLQGLDEKAEGILTCADSEIYWSASTKLKRCNVEELTKIKVQGRGGTIFGAYTSDYEKHIGKCDFLIMITDGYLMDTDIANMQNPGIPVFWLVTSGSSFNAPFGRVFDLKG